MDSLIDYDVWELNRLVKDMNHLTIYTVDLFIVVKVYIEPGTLFRQADNRRMGNWCITDFSEQNSSSFEFRVFPLDY